MTIMNLARRGVVLNEHSGDGFRCWSEPNEASFGVLARGEKKSRMTGHGLLKSINSLKGAPCFLLDRNLLRHTMYSTHMNR